MSKKRMLETVQLNNGQTHYIINASSVDVINTCLRKAFYLLKKDYRKDGDESDAQAFGSAIHAALAAFYSGDPNNKTVDGMIAAFNQYEDRLKIVEPGSKRTLETGHKIIRSYVETYKNDPWVVLNDFDGKPMVERSFEFKLNEEISIHGTIDAIMRNVETNEIAIFDHKTTSTLGDGFFQGLRPRLQFAIYTWAGMKMGLNVSKFVMNGIQVAKTKCDLARAETTYNADDINEALVSLEYAVEAYKKLGPNSPMNTTQCTTWGGCQYLKACSVTPSQRKFVLESEYGVKNELI